MLFEQVTVVLKKVVEVVRVGEGWSAGFITFITSTTFITTTTITTKNQVYLHKGCNLTSREVVRESVYNAKQAFGYRIDRTDTDGKPGGVC